MDDSKRKPKKSVSRRDFLKSIGGGAVGAGVAAQAIAHDLGAAQGAGPLDVADRRLIKMEVNGKPVSLEVEARETLLHILRDRLGLTGSKRVCDRGECGGCTVLLDGKPVYSCLLLGVQADGKTVRTIEGLAVKGKLHPVQQAFIDKDGYQCGYCTPGFIMATAALLDRTSTPAADEVESALAGNICRCGNYRKIREAVAAAAEAMRKG